MVNKKLLLIATAMVLITCLGAISAADVNDTTESQQDTTTYSSTTSNHNTVQATQEPTKTINKTAKTKTKTATVPVTNYTELSNKLTDSSAAEETTISLEGEDDTYNITEPITVSEAIKNLIINGNGKTIDGQGNRTFLNISHTCNLVINNLTIQNCSINEETDTETPSGAIVSRAGNVVINNTKMTDNVGITSGAIHIETYSDSNDAYNVSILNSEFSNNAGLMGGGAISYFGNEGSNFTIDNCIFNSNGDSNLLVTTGGALLLSSNGTTKITNSIFESNQGMMGGAIALVNGAKSTITNSTFKTNKGYGGGAIYIGNDGELEISNTEFDENEAGYGGAIYLDSTNNTALTNVTFTLNHAETGAAIFQINENGTTKINKSQFINNTGELRGAISYIGAENTSLEIYDTSFIQNGYDYKEEYTTSNGGAISATTNGTFKVVNSTFNNNVAADYGGAISLYGYENSCIEITGSYFTDSGIYNRDVQPAQNGGAIYIESIGNTTLNNNNFTKNYARYGSAVYYVNQITEYPEIKTNNTQFVINNTSFDHHGYNNRYGMTTDAGTLYIESNNTVVIDNSQFTNNMANQGGAINYIGYDESSIEIDNSKFDSNGKQSWDFPQNGGAIYLETEGNIRINKTEFANNLASNGGAIYYTGSNTSNIEINNSKFDTNGKGSYENAYSGGAAYIETGGNITVTNTEFLSNHAMEAAALYINQYNESNVIIDNSTFDSNGDKYSYSHYTDMAAAIYLQNIGNTTITDSRFTNNNAEDGTIYYTNTNENTTFIVKNTLFDSNGFGGMEHTEEGAIAVYSKNNVSIINSTFNSNAGCEGGALVLSTANVTIVNSTFYNNGAVDNSEEMEGGTIRFSGATDESTLIITNSVFDSNRGMEGVALELSNINATITNTNFTYNTLFLGGEEMEGGFSTIYSYNVNLILNHTNFIGNGLPSNFNIDDLSGEMEIEGSGLIYHDGNNNLTIDNSNFIANIGAGESGGIIYYYGAEYYQYYDENHVYHSGYRSNSTLTINHTTFQDNLVYAGEMEEIECEGLIIYIWGNANIDNTYFAHNKMGSWWSNEGIDQEEMSGVIYTDDYNNYFTCNVTNSVFIENNPANFIIKDDQIVLNYSYYEEYQGQTYFELMIDGYMPNYANVTIFLDESEEGTPYKLVSEYTIDPYSELVRYILSKVYVDGFTVNDDNYLIKMVVNQTEESQYYDRQIFHNNTYYFILPHNYTLSVNAKSPIKCDDNTTINGKAYYVNSTDEEVTFKNKPVSLYINGTYIATTNTNENGEYEFNYTGKVIGTHNITVAFNETLYLPRIVNTTTFDVVIRDSVLNINTTETKIGQKTNITFNLTDTDGVPIANANITFYIDNQEVNITTDENGIYVYECKINKTGDNYVLAFYDGDYSHTKAMNSTIFNIKKLNTTITVTATNTTVNGQTTIKGKLVDENNKKLAFTPILIYIDEDTINKETDENGEFEFTYPATIAGENYVAVIFKGNINYTDSTNKTAFHVEKLNSTITVTPTTAKIGNVTFTVQVEGKDGKSITNGTIVVYNEKDEIVAGHEITGKTTTVTIHDITSGTYTFDFVYEGNDTYNPSSTTKTVTIIPESHIEIEVLNNTEGNVVIEYTVTNDKNEPLKQQNVNITLPNGTKTTAKTNNKGKITLTDKTAKTGNTTTTAKIATTEKLKGTTANKNITIIPDYEKIIKEKDEIINNLNDTIQKLNNEIKELTKDLNKAKKTINNLTQQLNQAKNQIKTLNNTIKKLEKELNKLQDRINAWNKTSIIRAVPENNTIGNTLVVVTLDNKLADPITNAQITIKNKAGETIGTGKTDKKGIAVIPV
ncbi:MAG: hypothetical protein BZ138_03980, partial [Methanosphaera sp. rholeuAM270]